ncbi:MAG: hypothetical protein PHV34_18325 [Verrucomicrobiae bacterium]|nr:hypothetical protein [Verrucomicrobiae bacterium]
MGCQFATVQRNIEITDPHHIITGEMKTGDFFGLEFPVGPILFSTDPDAQPLGRLIYDPHPGLCVKKLAKWTSVYCALPAAPARLLRGVARYAGVHLYSDKPDVVYANQSFLCLNCALGGERILSFPEPCDVLDLLKKKKLAAGVSQIKINLPDYGVVLLKWTTHHNK